MFDTLKEAKAWVRSHSEIQSKRQKRPYTCVEVRITEGPYKGDWGIGFSKCRPSDEWSEEEGIKRARGRAEKELALSVLHTRAEAWEQYLNSKVTLECPKCGHRVRRAVRFTLNHCLCSEPPVPMHRARVPQDDISGALTSTERQANPNADPGRGWKVVDANEAEAALQAAMQRDA